MLPKTTVESAGGAVCAGSTVRRTIPRVRLVPICWRRRERGVCPIDRLNWFRIIVRSRFVNVLKIVLLIYWCIVQIYSRVSYETLSPELFQTRIDQINLNQIYSSGSLFYSSIGLVL